MSERIDTPNRNAAVAFVCFYIEHEADQGEEGPFMIQQMQAEFDGYTGNPILNLSYIKNDGSVYIATPTEVN